MAFGTLRGAVRPPMLMPTAPAPATVEEARRLLMAERSGIGFPTLTDKRAVSYPLERNAAPIGAPQQTVMEQGMDAPPSAQFLPAALAAAMPAPSPAFSADEGMLARAVQERPMTRMDANSIDGAQIEQRKPKPFARDGIGRDIIGTILDIAAGSGGQQGGYWAGKRRRADIERQEAKEAAAIARGEAQRMETRGWQVEDRNFIANKPESFMSGRDRVRFDPTTGESEVVYDGPEDYQTYADTLGLDPEADRDDYNSAVQDWVLKGNGPTAIDAKGALEQMRQVQRLALRATPTYAQTHPRARASGGGRGAGGPPRSTSAVVAPILAKMASGKPLTAGEQQALAYGRGGGGGGGRLPVVSSPEQARRLPSGSRFKTPDGTIRTVP